MRQVTVVKLDSKLVAEYRKICKQTGWPINHMIEKAMKTYLPIMQEVGERLMKDLAGLQSRT